MPSPTKPLNIRMPKGLLKKIRDMAILERRSVSAMAILLLEKALKE